MKTKKQKKIISTIGFIALILLILSLTPAQTQQAAYTEQPAYTEQTLYTEQLAGTEQVLSVTEDGQYTSKEELALYIHTYGHLPSNFISKTKAEAAGWDSSKGNLQEVLPGMSIGGSHFGNYDGKLPESKGRQYTECDVNYHGGYRGAERIIFSNDGLIFYTDDHYETFEQLY